MSQRSEYIVVDRDGANIGGVIRTILAVAQGEADDYNSLNPPHPRGPFSVRHRTVTEWSPLPAPTAPEAE